MGRDSAIELFDKGLSADQNLLDQLWTLSGLRLVCHCTPNQAYHGDVLIHRFSERYPDAFDRSSTSVTPDSAVLDYLAMLREELPSDPDEGAARAGAGWTGSGDPMLVGTGHTARPYCDGQSLAPIAAQIPDST